MLEYNDFLITDMKEAKSIKRSVFKVAAVFFSLLTLWLLITSIPETQTEFVSPCPTSGCNPPSPTPAPTITPEAKTPQGTQIGLASYYSIDGCIGCNDNRIMANRERLDDNKLTVAYNDAVLNTKVRITNLKTGLIVTAKVTDRGGFKKYGKIIDLSVATKNALGCGDVCRVKVEEI